MTYLEAVANTAQALRSRETSEADVSNGLALARIAWQNLACDSDPTWDVVGLELLALNHPTNLPAVTPTVSGPDHDSPQLRAALTNLLGLLARWHDRAGAESTLLATQLHHSASAAGLRRAARLLS